MIDPAFKVRPVIGVFSDGGVVWSTVTKIASRSDVGGTWAYCFVNLAGERYEERSGVLLPAQGVGGTITNNVTELQALTLGVLAVPDGAVAHFHSDSNCSLRRVFDGAQLNGVPIWLVEQTLEARKKLARLHHLTWTLLDGHPGPEHLASGYGKRGNPVSEHNCFCDKACKLAWPQYLKAQAEVAEVEQQVAA